jgi:hypothetical protein
MKENGEENERTPNYALFGRLLGLLDLATESLAQWGVFTEQLVTQRVNTILFRSTLEVALRHFYPDCSLVFCVHRTHSKNKFRDFTLYCKEALNTLKVILNDPSTKYAIIHYSRPPARTNTHPTHTR